MSKLPCYKCITFPICLSRYQKSYPTTFVYDLVHRCSIINKYVEYQITDTEVFDWDDGKVKQIQKYFHRKSPI